MRRRAGQTDPLRHTADRRDELVHLVPHEQTAIPGFGALTVFDLNGAGIFLHFRQSMDDFVPSEIAAGYLQDDIFEKTRTQEARRAAPLAGADPHRHVELLVEIAHPQLKALPHVWGKRPEGHAADHERIDLADRRGPPIFRHEFQALLRRQNPPQKRA